MAYRQLKDMVRGTRDAFELELGPAHFCAVVARHGT